MTEVKLNFGLSPDFSLQLKVFAQWIAERTAKSKVIVTQCVWYCYCQCHALTWSASVVKHLQVMRRLITVRRLHRVQLHLCSSSWSMPVRKQASLTRNTSLASRSVWLSWVKATFSQWSESSCSKVYMIADTWYCFLQFTTSERIEPIFDLKVCGFSLTLKGMMRFLLFIWYLTSLMSLYLFIIDVWRVQDKQKSCRWIVMKFSGPFHFGPSPIPKQFDRGHTFLSP